MKISIIGAGSFGTALAQVLSKNNEVLLIARDMEIVESINKKNINHKYFPNIILNKEITVFQSYKDIGNSDIIILAIPSKVVLVEAKKIKKYSLVQNFLLINTAKGFSTEDETILKSLKKIHENSCSILGPTFASNLIKNEYSAFTVASDQNYNFTIVKNIFKDTNIILDYSENYQVIEMASILKNIFAIANGLYSSIDDSINTKYAFLTQSYKEMNMILEHFFGNISLDYTKNGVFGDLLLTSLNDQSRNKTLGQLIGRGFYKVDDSSSITLEGIRSTKKIYKIVSKEKLNTPIINFVFEVLNNENVHLSFNRCMKNLTNNEIV